jgi:hypothetical protein
MAQTAHMWDFMASDSAFMCLNPFGPIGRLKSAADAPGDNK